MHEQALFEQAAAQVLHYIICMLNPLVLNIMQSDVKSKKHKKVKKKRILRLMLFLFVLVLGLPFFQFFLKPSQQRYQFVNIREKS